jgi:hypothetical protein
MALSPNYGWAEPDNSSLVKNGAQDIRALGDAIDTSVWNVGFGQAGKNKIINGDFTINQRSFTSTTTSGTFGFDRFFNFNVDGTCTYSAQTFTVGAAPVAGYEATNFARLVTTGQTLSSAFTFLAQRIESVRTFAAQPVTVSFWAKSATGTPKIAIELDQQFGTGGSARVTTAVGQVTISTGWTRYSATITVPSIAGKTIGTSNYVSLNLIVSAGSDFNARTGSMGIQSNTFDFWGVQAEYGSKATPFQTASGGSLQGELAMCQRYYYRVYEGTGATRFGSGMAYNTTLAEATIFFPVTMRTRPTGLEQSGTAANYGTVRANSAVDALTSVPTFTTSTPNFATVSSSSANLVSGNATFLCSASSAAYLGWSAEL